MSAERTIDQDEKPSFVVTAVPGMCCIMLQCNELFGKDILGLLKDVKLTQTVTVDPTEKNQELYGTVNRYKRGLSMVLSLQLATALYEVLAANENALKDADLRTPKHLYCFTNYLDGELKLLEGDEKPVPAYGLDAFTGSLQTKCEQRVYPNARAAA